jgi:sarcosine oxidase, subunit beta
VARGADVVVCGAGIAGLAAAYHLAVRCGIQRVVIVDEREPMTLTTDKGTQGYRNWWPGPDDTMLRLVTRSIDLLEELALESGNVFRLNRRGYVFATARDDELARLRATAMQVSSYGMGPLRVHAASESYEPAPPEGFADQPVGADLLLGEAAHRAFPYLAPDVKGALHVRRAGWLQSVAMGDWILKRATAHGVTLVRDRVSQVRTAGGRVREVGLASGASIATERFVIAAGPALPDVARLLDLELPVFNELHSKVVVRDPQRVVPRDAPFVIWADSEQIAWTPRERAALANEDGGRGRHLTEPLPAGVHVRPFDGPHGDELFLIWTYENDRRDYAWPPTFDPRTPSVVLQGMIRMIPGFAVYRDAPGMRTVDGGYYCKTPENRPLVGPLPVEGAYVIGALSGSGLMSSMACGELVALHLTERPLPEYARWFLPSRYDDSAYKALVQRWGPLVGQL